jgi:hypothetical protein
MEGRTEISPPGDKFTPWDQNTTSPRGSKFNPRGEVKNKPVGSFGFRLFSSPFLFLTVKDLLFRLSDRQQKADLVSQPEIELIIFN